MAIITITGEPGALGEEVAARVAGHLGFSLIDRKRLAQIWGEMNPDGPDLCKVDEGPGSNEAISGEVDALDAGSGACVDSSKDLIAHLAEEQDLVIIGMGAEGLFHNRPGTLHVRFVAPRKSRVNQMRARENISVREAAGRVRSLELLHARHLRSHYGLNPSDPSLYDLSLRMDRLSVEQALKLIVTALDDLGLQHVPRRLIVGDLLPETHGRPGYRRFVNATEGEFARFLEFYQIPYEYEPRTFTLEVDDRGRVTEAFTPDFYLPEQDLYIELTTMKQSLVTRKNRKVRKLRRLYPEVRIQIFYQRDYYSLMAKYGLLEGRDNPNPEGVAR